MKAQNGTSTTSSDSYYSEQRLPTYSVFLDFIRASAAFFVVAGHARMLFFGIHTQSQILLAAGGGQAVPITPGLGTQAVNVFFVLSGFLVGGSAWRSQASDAWSWRDYAAKRLTRLWIVLIPALIIGAGLDATGRIWLHGIYTGPPGQGMVPQGLEGRSTILVFVANVFYLQGFRAPTFGTNAALWSLANELWYYTAFPLILHTYYLRRALKRLAYGFLALGLFVFVGKTIAGMFTVWLMGAVVARLPLRVASNYTSVSVWLSLLQFLGVCVLTRVHPFYPLTGSILLGTSFSILLYALLHLREPTKSLSFQRVSQTMASFSYSLYLYHVPMLVFLTGTLIKPWHAWPVDARHVSIAALLVAVTYFYSYGLYWLFERRTDQFRKWLFPKDRMPSPQRRSS